MKLLCLVVLTVFSAATMAIDVVEFSSDVERERYQRLTYELRCPKCQNQNLIDSNSQISEDLRREVARLIHEGESDDEIRRQLVALYGDFILYRPPVQNNTIVLWLGPVLMMGIGLFVFAVILLKRIRTEDQVEEGVQQTESSPEEVLVVGSDDAPISDDVPISNAVDSQNDA